MIELDVIDSETADADAGAADRDDSGPTFWRHWSESETGDRDEGNDLTEFAPGDSEPPSGASRRQFLQLMGAAMAMAGLAGCRRPEEKILPYARDPETVMPGIADHYATGMPFRGVLRPVVAESHEGRPTKIEGNGEHPMGQNGTGPYAQASVLNLYDPDRSRSVRQEGSQASWNDFVSFCRQL
ncbi:MAG: hydrogenase, partial [Bacteroidetes bacterium SW_7_64_58]